MPDEDMPRAGDPYSAPLPREPSPPHRILVVEDDISTRQLSTQVLIHSGYEVDAAEDGAAAWEALSADSYDLMITDNNMPKLTGVELLKKLRAARMALPVIMATGTLPKEEFTRQPWLQPAATLLKPYAIEALLGTVKKVLREADGTADAPRQCPTNSPRRILVVDEDSDLRRLYTDVLVRPGYHVDAAEDGAAGWEALQANNYDLLITEHAVPKLTGVELVRKVRAAHMDLPVVMATGRLPTDELARNPSLQLAAMLVKPFAVDALLDTVQNVLRATDSPRSPREILLAAGSSACAPPISRDEQIAPPPDWQSQPSADGWQL
jgi:DNA-binding response OmpR family regulator